MRGEKKQTHTSRLLLLLARTVEARRVVTKPPTRVSPSLFTPDISAAADRRSDASCRSVQAVTWSEPLIETRSAVLGSEEKREEGMKFAVTAVLWMCLALRTATVRGKKKKKTHNMYLNC